MRSVLHQHIPSNSLSASAEFYATLKWLRHLSKESQAPAGNSFAALDRAVAAKDRPATMREANQVTFEVANMTTAYKLNAPVEVTKLDFYGRELEVWAQTKDANKLQTTARELRQTWDSLRATIAAKSATEAKSFDALVAQVEAAKTPADYDEWRRPCLTRWTIWKSFSTEMGVR
jgi:hypothetical protein